MGVSLRISEPPGAERSASPGPIRQFPLSYAQETMLFWDRLVRRSAVYNVPIALHISGRLDVAALQKTIKLILTRHEVLRSHFLFTDHDPVQIVGPVPPDHACLSVVDLSGVNERQEPLAVEHAVNREARRPFDLSKDVMLRAVLFSLGKAEHILLLNMHHIAADGWSLGVLVRELSEGYLAFSEGKEPQLPALPIQYAGFAKWQRELLQGPERERLLVCWREQLAGVPEFSELLPLDRPRPVQQKFDGATIRTVLPEPFVTAMAELGQMRGATVFMVMLAAFQAFLQRYSGKNDIAVGVPVANRARTDFLNLIGCFINVVVIRGDLSVNASFLDLLSHIREASLAAFSHPELPFSELVRYLHPKRSMGHTPFFQVQFVFQNYPMPTIEWPGLNLTRYQVDTATAKFDLSVLVEPKDGLEIGFEYNTQLFEPTTMKRLLEEYTFLLQSTVKHPETRIGDFPVGTLACGA
jgi:hypothetical protein